MAPLEGGAVSAAGYIVLGLILAMLVLGGLWIRRQVRRARGSCVYISGPKRYWTW